MGADLKTLSRGSVTRQSSAAPAPQGTSHFNVRTGLPEGGQDGLPGGAQQPARDPSF